MYHSKKWWSRGVAVKQPFVCMKNINEAGHRALNKTLAVDLIVTVRNPADCVDATFPAPSCILVFSRFDVGA